MFTLRSEHSSITLEAVIVSAVAADKPFARGSAVESTCLALVIAFLFVPNGHTIRFPGSHAMVIALAPLVMW